jgi:outer membrane lipoprotein-sorting protein
MKILKQTHLVRPLSAALAGLALVATPLALVSPSAPASAQQSDQLDRAISAIRGISTLKANFIQTDRSGQSVSGVLTLKQPGNIRFEYEDSVNILIVSNGRSLYFIDYDVRQVERWPIRNSPLGALLDPTRDLKKYGRLMPTSNPNVVSVEVKDKERPEYGTITLIFVEKAGVPGGLELVSWVQLDSQNKRTTIRLTNQRYGVAVSDSAFRFRDPRVTTRRPG